MSWVAHVWPLVLADVAVVVSFGVMGPREHATCNYPQDRGFWWLLGMLVIQILSVLFTTSVLMVVYIQLYIVLLQPLRALTAAYAQLAARE